MKNNCFPGELSLLILCIVLFFGATTPVMAQQAIAWEENFKVPPQAFKPMPFWHINGELNTSEIRQQMKDAKAAGFSGVSLLPLASQGKKIGTTPIFLSDEYFERFQEVINIARELDMEVILYDDNDFPSGMAGGKLGELFPEHTMKRLDKIEYLIEGPAVFTDSVKAIKLMAAVAMNTATLERIEISNFTKDGVLSWNVPAGTWKVMLFPLVKDSWHKAFPVVDYLDTTAVRHMIDLTYEEYARHFRNYFGNTIKMTFFDDVGFWRHPRTWTAKFNEKFEALHGYDPRPFYPALWENIGPETEAVRNDFFNTRAELLAEGFPKLVGQWTAQHGLKSTGHPPGNYDPTPIDMSGDIFKFYRYTQVPLVDVIIKYQYGQNGHKLISSAADYYDRPVVSTEIYGAFNDRDYPFDSLMLYRPLMEMLVRGVNFVIPHGMWYNPEKVYIPPLVSPYNPKLAPALPAYSNFVGRACLLLQGGRRVSEIGVIYPFEELAGHFVFDNPDGIRQGFYISPVTDYMQISGILTNEVRRDFTFIHPEFFQGDKYQIENGYVRLNNQENFQEYKVLFLTGCNIISYKTLSKIKTFYEHGGTIISTTRLPHKSSERGQDQQVVQLVRQIFGMDVFNQNTYGIQINSNQRGGKAVFIPQPDKRNIEKALSAVMPDVRFMPNPSLASDFGKFGYIHKVKRGRHIYYFANSSNETIESDVVLCGKHSLQCWNPHTGEISPLKTSIEPNDKLISTRVHLNLKPVSSVFWISTNN